MSDKIINDFVCEFWLDSPENDNISFLTASSIDRDCLIVLKYCIKYLLHPFIEDDIETYLKTYCHIDEVTINKLSVLLLDIDSVLTFRNYDDSEVLPFE